jgi:hypothetical protein
MHISDVSLHRKLELAWKRLTERLGLGKATPGEVLWRAEWESPVATATTSQNQTRKRGWILRWVLVSPGAHHNT